MASLRNAIPQRPYRERAQPGSRAKLGILEKHKDYSARAKDYNEKKARLKILRQKATDRNPDEFHFGMMRSKTKDGIKLGDRGNKVLSHEVVQLMKTQDAGYLRTVQERVRRERTKLEEGLQIVVGDGLGSERKVVGGKSKAGGQHLVFVEDEEEQSIFDPAVFFETDKQGVNHTHNRPRRRSEPDTTFGIPDDQSAQIHKSNRQKVAELQAQKDESKRRQKSKHDLKYRKVKLDALRKQEEELRTAEEELDLQRAKMAHTVGGTNKNGVKFKIRERLR